MKGHLITFGKSTFKGFVPDMGHKTCGNVDIVAPRLDVIFGEPQDIQAYPWAPHSVHQIYTQHKNEENFANAICLKPGAVSDLLKITVKLAAIFRKRGGNEVYSVRYVRE
jgi:hypothetical protein